MKNIFDGDAEIRRISEQASAANREVYRWVTNWSHHHIQPYAQLYGKTERELSQILPDMIHRDFVARGILSLDDAKAMEQYIKESFALPNKMQTMLKLSSWHETLSPTSHFFMEELSIRLRFIRPSNLLVLGFFVWAGATQTSVTAQTRNQRLINNPSLLLELSDEEAALLEQNEESKAICAIISDAYHYLSFLSEEELQQLDQEIKAAISPETADTQQLLAR